MRLGRILVREGIKYEATSYEKEQREKKRIRSGLKPYFANFAIVQAAGFARRRFT